MSFEYADRVKETTATTGTGDISLGGTSAGYRTFVNAVGDGNECYYCIVHQSSNEWEVGKGRITSGAPATLARIAVLASSNSGSLVNFSAGTKDVFQTAPAYRFQNVPPPQRNRIINGDMRIDQRNASNLKSSMPTGKSYLVDRWIYNGSVAGKFNAQQNLGAVTPPTGMPSYLGLSCASSYTSQASDFFYVYQGIEGSNLEDLGWGTASAKPVTVSFWVYSSVTGSHCATVKNNNSTRCYPILYSIPTANTWTRIAITIPGDTSGSWSQTTGAGLWVLFDLGSGSNFNGTSGAWTSSNVNTVSGAVKVVATTNATFYFTGVQLEVGIEPSAYEHQDIGDQLIACQRYFEKSMPLANVPGYAPGAGNCVLGFSHPTAVYVATIAFQVLKRTGPTVTLYDGAGTAGKISYFAGSWNNNGAYTVNAQCERSFKITATITSATQANFEFAADAEY